MLNFSLSTKNLPHLNLNKDQDENHSIVYPVQLPSLFSTLILSVDVEVVYLHVVATLLVDGQSEGGFVEVSDGGASLVWWISINMSVQCFLQVEELHVWTDSRLCFSIV